jgi:hypothetical protein
MKITFAIASAVFILSAGAASAQRGGDTIPMRDGSTIVTVGGGCVVQYGGRGQRINNANRCNEDDMRRADQIMSGGGYGGGPGYGGGQGFGALLRAVPGQSPAAAAACVDRPSRRSAAPATGV